ncbi:MAG TPA: hypothetical protein PK876_07550 [Elusimicrobiota bacterium]|nr:hypothetical protein [Elusimicrobiota bacterium]
MPFICVFRNPETKKLSIKQVNRIDPFIPTKKKAKVRFPPLVFYENCSSKKKASERITFLKSPAGQQQLKLMLLRWYKATIAE